ncbi:hypothetical protein [Hahella sp. KA22]|uniref:hypothetical protein n=1 Tax=Hahella sp. KA22 TaxID=1628392 RepID=UPI000FDF5FEE|nr:hypothetical protein [Hahella sp. KA22]AZZ92923.1 hypothetical protein ENC22_17620 [Hahella sp. KA22]
MVRIIGPASPRYRFEKCPVQDKYILVENAPFETAAATLGEALTQYANAFSASIRPFDGDDNIPLPEGESKYFYYLDKNSVHGEAIVDIHIHRHNGEHLCPGQDMNFQLCSGDAVTIGALAC